MPSKSIKQQHFFQAVKKAKHDPNYGDERLRKVANSMTDKDIDDFTEGKSEFKTKKAILSVLKDIVEPMYLNEDTWQEPQDPVSNTFHVKADWATYIKPYIGQPLSPKEIEALHNFKEKQPTTVSRTEIWYNTTDNFNISHTTVIKKMKDSGQFSFTAFSKQERPTPDDEKNADDQSSGGEESSMNAGGPTDMPQGQMPPGSPTPPAQEPEKKEQKEKDDIIVTKSILFKDDIKGASVLIDFLKKLDL